MILSIFYTNLIEKVNKIIIKNKSKCLNTKCTPFQIMPLKSPVGLTRACLIHYEKISLFPLKTVNIHKYITFHKVFSRIQAYVIGIIPIARLKGCLKDMLLNLTTKASVHCCQLKMPRMCSVFDKSRVNYMILLLLLLFLLHSVSTFYFYMPLCYDCPSVNTRQKIFRGR